MRIAALVAGVAALVVAPQLPARAGDDPRQLAASYNATGVDLLKTLAAEPGNVALSPFGVGETMGMVTLGAGGETRTELGKALHLPKKALEEPAGLGKALTQRSPADAAQVTAANALLLARHGDRVRKSYRDAVTAGFDAQVSVGADLAAVNGWVKEKTGGQIGKILDTLDPQAVAVLLNAVSLKAKWEKPFEANRTGPDAFALASGQTVETPFMRTSGMFRMVETDVYAALALPYAGGGMTMTLVVPRGAAAADAQFAAMLPEALAAAAKAEPETVDVAVPKFAMAAQIDLIEPFRKLGLNAPFDGGVADLGRMVDLSGANATVHVSQVRHGVAITVDEAGTEAAAATAAEIVMRSIRKKRDFRADRPFLFAIADNATGVMVFIGRVADPRPAK